MEPSLGLVFVASFHFRNLLFFFRQSSMTFLVKTSKFFFCLLVTVRGLLALDKSRVVGYVFVNRRHRICQLFVPLSFSRQLIRATIVALLLRII